MRSIGDKTPIFNKNRDNDHYWNTSDITTQKQDAVPQDKARLQSSVINGQHDVLSNTQNANLSDSNNILRRSSRIKKRPDYLSYERK